MNALLALFVLFLGVSCKTAPQGLETGAARIDEGTDFGFTNMVLIGWDGLERNRVLELLGKKKLPNLQRLIDEGSLVSIDVGEAGKPGEYLGKTGTKPGWAQILTGYSSDFVGVKTNLEYGPIPKGYTLFERLKERFVKDGGIETHFITGKINNTGARGPHEICLDCGHRTDEGEKTFWWEKRSSSPGRTDKKNTFAHREGEPYFNALSSIDIYKNALGKNTNVLNESLTALNGVRGKRFFSFFHFEEPDEFGHRFGESSVQYQESIIRNDNLLGLLRSKLEAMGVAQKTVIILTSDHGMDPGKKKHRYAPHTILAANVKNLRATGDRSDVAPTIYDLYGFKATDIVPALHGKSLLTESRRPVYSEPKTKSSFKVGYFHGGRTLMLYRAMIHGFFNAEGVDVALLTKLLGNDEYFRVSASYLDISAVPHFGKVTGTELVQQMFKDGLHAATVGESAFIKDVANGGELVAVAELGFDTSKHPGHAIAVRPGVAAETVADLKKLRWASRRSSGGDDLFLREFLSSRGLNADTDVQVSWGLDEKQLRDGMRDGSLDAAFYHLYALRREVRKGTAKIHTRFNWVNPELSQSLLVVSRKTLRENRDLIKQFLRGYLRRIRFEHSLSTEIRRQEREGEQKGLEMETDFQGMNLPQYRSKPTVRLELLEETQRLLLKHKMISRAAKLATSIDNSLVQEVFAESAGELPL